MAAAYLRGTGSIASHDTRGDGGWQASSCDGKARFATPSLARDVLARRRHDRPLIAYRCDNCGGWHLGQPAHPDAASLHKPRPHQRKMPPRG